MEWVKSLRATTSASEENEENQQQQQSNVDSASENGATNQNETAPMTISSPTERIKSFMTDSQFKSAASKSWKSKCI